MLQFCARSAVALTLVLLSEAGCERRPGSSPSNGIASDYQVIWISADVPQQIRAGRPMSFLVTFRNSGGKTLSNDRLSLSYHWVDSVNPSRFVEWNGKRTPVPHAVSPGAVEQVEMDVLPPASLGRYELQIDLVRENVAWFASKGTAKFWRMVEVE